MSIGYSSYRPRGRRRAVWWWSLAVVLTAAAVTALLVNGQRTETRRLTAFFDGSRTLALEADQAAEGFSRLISTELRTVRRDDFVVLMDRLASQMFLQAAGLDEMEAPDSAAAVREMLDLAFDSWQTGLAEFQIAIIEVADQPTSTAPVERLGGAVVQLRVGDLIYAGFLERAAMMIEDLDVTISEFPAISFISHQRALMNAEGLARAIRSSTEMGIRRDVAILQVVFEPLPTGGVGEEGEIILPAVDQLRFSAVIGNRGNIAQKGLTVSVSLRDVSGQALSTQDSGLLDLAPGEIGTVTFDVEAVEPSAEYLLAFNLTVVEDDLDIEDNVWESEIRINPR